MSWISIQVYAKQWWAITKRIPVFGLCFGNSPRKNAIALGAAALAVILGSIGVWLPAVVVTLHTAVPFLPIHVVAHMNKTAAINGNLLILVPSLIAPCAILLFGPWDLRERITHQVWLLGSTAVLYAFAFFIVITQLSVGVADKSFLLSASWWALAISAILLYFYELLDRVHVDIVGANIADRDDLMKRTLRNIESGH